MRSDMAQAQPCLVGSRQYRGENRSSPRTSLLPVNFAERLTSRREAANCTSCLCRVIERIRIAGRDRRQRRGVTCGFRAEGGGSA